MHRMQTCQIGLLCAAICDAVNVLLSPQEGRGLAGYCRCAYIRASALRLMPFEMSGGSYTKTWDAAIARTAEDTIAIRAFSGRLGRSIRPKYAVASVFDEASIPAPYPIQRNSKCGNAIMLQKKII